MMYQQFKQKRIIKRSFPDDSMENFRNSDEPVKPNNLITNGKFLNGEDPIQFSNQSGYNRIIQFSNPSTTTFVLEQKKSSELTYYELTCDNQPNSKYVLLFLFSCADIKKVELSKLIRVRMQTKDYRNLFPSLSASIVQKVEYEKNTWYTIKVIFTSPFQVTPNMYIDLNYTDKLASTMYFTDLTLYRVLMDAENFIYNQQLISYVDSTQYRAMSKTWNDLSGYGNVFTLSQAPMVRNDALQLKGISVKGLSSDKLTSTFSVGILFQLFSDVEEEEMDAEETQEGEDEEEDGGENGGENVVESFVSSSPPIVLLSIPGNEDYAIEIELYQSYMYIVSGDKRVRSSKKLYLSNKSMMVLTCSPQKNDTLAELFVDGEKVISTVISKLYLNEDAVCINRNKNVNMELYAILCYTRCISMDEMSDIRDYYLEKKNKHVKQFDVNLYYLDTLTDSTSRTTWSSTEESTELCPSSCESNCSSFLDERYGIRRYSDCIDNCKNVLMVCNEYCASEDNKKSKYCKSLNINNNKCPIAYRKKGQFHVYIAKGSPYAEKYGVYGERNYGSSMETARKTFQRNFPDCPVPEVFRPSSNSTCPFIVHDMNPCQSHACSNVDWNVKDYKQLKMTDSCKKAVSTYCHLNHEWDDMCYSWKPENKEKKKCIEMRKFFEDPKEYCRPSDYEIDEHPDFHKYIRKDKIPCWGCDISST
jgi:hypothetical protein